MSEHRSDPVLISVSPLTMCLLSAGFSNAVGMTTWDCLFILFIWFVTRMLASLSNSIASSASLNSSGCAIAFLEAGEYVYLRSLASGTPIRKAGSLLSGTVVSITWATGTSVLPFWNFDGTFSRSGACF